MDLVRRRSMSVAGIFLFALFISSGFGCGAPQESAAPDESAAPEVPAAKAGGFPEEDIPIYDGLARDYVSDDGPLLVVNGTTTDEIAKVLAFYRDRLPAKGWKEGVDPTAGGGAETLYFEKGTAKLTIMVSTDLGKTRVSVQVEGYQGG